MLSLQVNGRTYEVEVDPNTPLLWVLREKIGLTGTKYGCGVAQCGACTVHVEEKAVRSCITPVSSFAGKQIITIEGIGMTEEGRAVLEAWITEDVVQCGYCQSGQIMAAVALLKNIPKPSDKDINQAMDGILCRCGTYQRIRRAIHRAATRLAKGTKG